MKKRNRPPRFTRFSVLLLITLATLALFAGEVAAENLQRVGPINPSPSVGNFPAWYQDNTGITLEFCDPKNAAEAAGAWCLVGTAEVPNPPEVFPGEFFDEHFYYSVAADTDALPNAFLWEAAVEAAFATGDAVPGEQIVFTRIRIRIRDLTVNGDYRITHPYGIHVLPFDNNAGNEDQIFFTVDTGVAAGVFTGALKSAVGPFLLPADGNGDELPPVTGPLNQQYLSDASGPVTGSPYDNNFVRIEGPPNAFGTGVSTIETTNFTVMGRLFAGEIPGDVTVDRAEYTRNGAGDKVEVYATGLMTTPKRLPAGPPPTPFRPQLSFFHDNCVLGLDNITYVVAPGGADNTQMFNVDNNFWGQAPIAPIPDVCVMDSESNAGFPKAVVDEITISQAYYNPTAQTLSVRARSGDEVNPPTLTLEGLGDLANGFILVDPLVAPPAYAFVLSSAGGSNAFQVTTTPPAAAAPPPVTNVTLTVAPPALPGSATVGDNVTFIGTASGGNSPYQYQFMAKFADSGTFGTVQGYSTDNTWTWNTAGAPPTNYEIAVYARSNGSAAPLEAIATLNYALAAASTPPSSVGLAANPADNTQTGNTITFTATPTGGTPPFEYEFRVAISGGTLGVVQGYTTNNTWVWNSSGAPAAGYDIQVNVRRPGQAVPDTTTTIPYTLTGVTAPTSVSLTANPVDNTQTGGDVTFTAEAIGGTGPFEYEFLARFASGGPFGTVQGYSTDNTWTWTTTGAPAAAYEIMVMTRRVGQPVPFDVTNVIPYALTP